MKVILHADDFGASDETVDATIACFERGGLTSASIMPNMPATARALEFARRHPQFSFGVHLTYVSDGVERPLSAPSEVPDLVEASGLFLPSNRVRALALLGKLPLPQLELETRRQIRFVQEAGIPVSHLDSHGHLHKFSPFAAVLKAIAKDRDIARVRTVQNVYLRVPYRSPTYWLGGWWRRAIVANFTTTDLFYMPCSSGDTGWTDALLRTLARRNAATLEIGVHPGTNEAWRRAEAEDAMKAGKALREAGHQLVTWNDI